MAAIGSSSGIFSFPNNSVSSYSNSDRADYRCATYRKYESTWEYILDIYEGKRRWFDPGDGTIVDWEKAFLYLPQSKEEPPQAYVERVKRSRFDRKFRDAVHDSSNFVYEVTLLEETPPFIQNYEQDIDRQGNDLKTFLRSADIKALRDERCGILVDYPVAPRDEEGNFISMTAAEVQSEKMRPYLCLIDVRDVVNWKTEKKNGVERITQLTIREIVEVDDGMFSTKTVERYRVLKPGSYQLFERKGTVELDLDNSVVELIEEGETSLSEIPFVWYHVNPFELNNFEGMPPLLDLADLNLAYYRKVSNKDELLFKCTVPVFVVNPKEGSLVNLDTSSYFADQAGNYQQVATGNNKAISIGPNTLLQNCDAYFVEPSGSALAAIEADLKGIELAMDSKKYSFQSGAYATTPTATEVIMASLTNEANVAAFAKNKENAVHQIFQFWCDYEGYDRTKPGGIAVDLTALRKLQNRADTGYVDMLLRNQVISPDELAESIKESKTIQEVIDLESRIQEMTSLQQFPEGQNVRRQEDQAE